MLTRRVRRALASLACAILCGVAPDGVQALTIYNAPSQAEVTAHRDAWLAGIGGVTHYRVDFETGFAAGQSIENEPGLLPGGLVIRDFSESTAVSVEGAGSSKLGGSLPVGALALAAGSRQLVLDFSAAPVDYVAFRDIDIRASLGGTFPGGYLFVITPPLGSVLVLDQTTDSDASAEFFALIANDGLRISEITIQAGYDSPDLDWGLDDLEYGRFLVPEPGAAALLGTGLAGFAAGRARSRTRCRDVAGC